MRPGSYYCVSTPNLMGALIRFGTRNHWNHAGIVGYSTLIEAQPRGVARTGQDAYKGRDDLITNAAMPLTSDQASLIVSKALHLLGTPYGFLDIFALALYSVGIKFGWLRRRVLSEHRMICSQFVATCYDAAGITLVPGKQPQEVTPGDLANAIARLNSG